MHGRTNIVDSICLELHDGRLKITKTTKYIRLINPYSTVFFTLEYSSWEIDRGTVFTLISPGRRRTVRSRRNCSENQGNPLPNFLFIKLPCMPMAKDKLFMERAILTEWYWSFHWGWYCSFQYLKDIILHCFLTYPAHYSFKGFWQGTFNKLDCNTG